ncbi:MAG: hypothetical protein K6F27_04135 [Ruminococcus sp.]|nr:hypothetical protein [Ruminococcus sp.]
MKLYKKVVSTVSAIVLVASQICFDASATNIGGTASFSYNMGQANFSQNFGDDYALRQESGSNVTTGTTNYFTWSEQTTSMVVNEWRQYAVSQGQQPYSTTPTGSGASKGQITYTKQYKIPFGDNNSGLKKTIEKAKNEYKPKSGVSPYTLFNTDGWHYHCTSQNKVLCVKDFLDESKTTFQMGDNTYSSIKEMYNAASASDKDLIKRILKQVLLQAGFTEAEVNNIIQLMLAGGTEEPQLQEMQKVSLHQNPFNLSVIENILRPWLTGLGGNWNRFPQSSSPLVSGNAANPSFNPRRFADPAGLLRALLQLYPNGRPDVNSIRTSGTRLPLADTYYADKRYELVSHLVNAMSSWGVNEVDVTTMLDYRIKAIKIGTKTKDTPTGRYVWTVEKLDQDDQYTDQGLAGTNIVTTSSRFSFRPQSAGKYRITCYPEYKKESACYVSAGAMQYAYLTDTNTVLFAEQNFVQGDTSMKGPSGNTIKSVEYRETLTTQTGWQFGQNRNNSTVSTYINPYLQSWELNVTADMVDRNIVDFTNGGIALDFETERIE